MGRGNPGGALQYGARGDRLSNRTVVRRDWWAKLDAASGVIVPAARTKQRERRTVAAVVR